MCQMMKLRNITLVLLSLSFLWTMIRSFIILQKYIVVGKTRLSMVDTDNNKVPYEDIFQKSADYFKSKNKEVLMKGAFLFKAIASAEDKIALILASAEDKIASAEDKIALILASAEDKIASVKKELALTEANAKSEIKFLESELVHVNKELLYSKQAVTSRGILEHFLKGSQTELGLKGNFNAAAVCEALKKHKVIVVLYAMLLIGFHNIPNLHFRKVECSVLCLRLLSSAKVQQISICTKSMLNLVTKFMVHRGLVHL